jgi:hypothetical protein
MEKNMFRGFCYFTIAILFSFLFPTLSKAVEDPVIKMIDEAVQYYKDGRFTAAVTSLDSASQLIHRKKGETLGRLLPEPLDDWSAELVDSKTIGVAMFGGATTAERKYIKSTSSVTVKFSTDSPMMQSMLMMFNNPIFASSAGKIEMINGQKAIVDFQETSGNINIVIGDNLLITLEGSNIKRDDLMDYAGKIDMDKLAKLP